MDILVRLSERSCGGGGGGVNNLGDNDDDRRLYKICDEIQCCGSGFEIICSESDKKERADKWKIYLNKNFSHVDSVV